MWVIYYYIIIKKCYLEFFMRRICWCVQIIQLIFCFIMFLFFILCQLICFQKLLQFVFFSMILHCIFNSMILHILLLVLTCLNSSFLLAHTSSKLVIKNYYHSVVFLSLWMTSYLILWLIWSALLSSVSNSCRFWQQACAATIFFWRE